MFAYHGVGRTAPVGPKNRALAGLAYIAVIAKREALALAMLRADVINLSAEKRKNDEVGLAFEAVAYRILCNLWGRSRTKGSAKQRDAERSQEERFHNSFQSFGVTRLQCP